LEPLPTGGKKLKLEILKSAGLTKSTVNRYEHIAEIEEEVFENYIQEKLKQKH
jgi:hypothetical protein